MRLLPVVLKTALIMRLWPQRKLSRVSQQSTTATIFCAAARLGWCRHTNNATDQRKREIDVYQMV